MLNQIIKAAEKSGLQRGSVVVDGVKYNHWDGCAAVFIGGIKHLVVGSGVQCISEIPSDGWCSIASDVNGNIQHSMFNPEMQCCGNADVWGNTLN